MSEIHWTEMGYMQIASNSHGLVVGEIEKHPGNSFFCVNQPASAVGRYMSMTQAKAAIVRANGEGRSL